MNFSQSRKKHFFTILFTLFLTVQITACGTDENFSAEQEDTITTTEVDTGINENSPADISGVDSGSVTEDLDPDNDNLLEVGGKLTVVDSDVEESTFIAITSTGDYGSLTINSTGTWHYSVENNLSVVQNLSTGSSLIDPFSISSADGTPHQIIITIIGVNEANQPALISGVDSGTITEDATTSSSGNTLYISGVLSITDNDIDENIFFAESKNTNFGSFILYRSGFWVYSANNNLAAIQNLESGETLTDSIGINSIDGTVHTITITINGVDEPNIPAIISGVDTGTITEDTAVSTSNTLVISGTLSITDNDIDENIFFAESKNTNFGSFILYESGFWRYSANNSLAVIQSLESGETLTDSIGINSIDGTAHTILITINGVDESNIPAIISGVDTGTVTEDIDSDNDGLLEVSGKLNITDADSGEAVFKTAAISGSLGNLFIDASGNWSYAANNNQTIIQNLTTGQTLTDSIGINSIDGTAHTILITINGVDEPNIPAIISGVDTGAVTEDFDPDNDGLLEVSGKLNITDANSGEAIFKTAGIAGSLGNLFIDASGNWSYAANNNQNSIQNLSNGDNLIDIFTISSVDNTTHTILITINGVNETNTSADITLSWTTPTEREDNTPLAIIEISAYKIYYGTTSGQYNNNITINNNQATSTLFENFATGTYYFAITTIDTDGRESQQSSEVQKTI